MTEQSRGFRLESLSKSYGPVRALRDVGFDVPQGQVVGLVGENGAGKSTLLRILLGQIRPDAGEVRDIDGSPFDLGTPSGARAVGVRVVQQEPEIVPWLSLAENLYLGELPRRFSKAALNAMARRHLDALGFGRDLDVTRRAQELTPAQRQLAEIARALKPGVRLLAFDEPTSSLSEDETERLLRIIEDLRTQGLAIVYVSHRLREVTRLADRIAVLRDGQLVAERTAGTTPDELVRLMVGRPLGSWLQHTDNTRGQVLLRVEGLRAPGIIHADLTVRAGEVVGLSGLIGAGRTELAHAICGVTRPTGGTVTFDGKPVAFRHPAEAMAVGLAYAPEERKKDALFLDRSVLENVTIAANRKLARRRFLRRAEQVRMAEDLRQRLRIKTHSLKTPIRNLSGGNQQKVVLARLIATGPRLLVLDEPTRGIDVGAKQEIYELIEQMTREGMGVLLISSELPELLALSDRVVVIREGRSVAELPGTEATEEVVLALSMPSSTDDLSATGAA